MIRIIMGDKGSGKTKRLIDMANELAKDAKGDVVYIDDDQRYMYELRHQIRFVETSEYKKQKVYGPEWLYGFLCGMLSANFDVTAIFVDAFYKHCGGDFDALEGFFGLLNALSDAQSVDFILSISGEEKDVPEFIRKYAV